MMRRVVSSAVPSFAAGTSAAALSFKPRIRDTQFLMEEVLNMYPHYEKLGATDANKELVDTLLEESGKLCTSTLFPCYMSADDESCHLKDDVVTVPKTFQACYDAVKEGGWIGISSPEEFGGQGLPASVGFLAREMMATANWSFGMYPGLSAGAAQTIQAWGTPEQKEVYLTKLVEGTWTGTMCLTEPHCGTDLGQVKTKAIENGDGTYKVTGTKIFISAGDHELTENILHIVLAKLPGAPAGTKGISLFLVPKYVIKADKTLETKRNVTCTGLEVKMGIKASATCQMTFEDSVGYMIGKPNEGMKEMFTFMNAARVGTAIQGVAHAELAYQNGLEYAKERMSMRAVSGTKCADKVGDTIINHASVRNNLLFAKSIAEGGRCMVVDVARILDKMEKAKDEQARKVLDSELGFLTPIAKGFLTEMGTESALACQSVFGGHGFIKGNGMEQIVRDSRIATLYEGTTMIQSLDFIGRKIMLSKINEASAFGGKVNALAKGNMFGKGDISTMAWGLWVYQKQWKLLITRMKVSALKDKDNISANSVDFLMASGYMTLGYYWLRMAIAAQAKVAANEDPDGFYQMKIDTAAFYYSKVFPRFNSHLQMATTPATVVMRVKESAMDL